MRTMVARFAATPLSTSLTGVKVHAWRSFVWWLADGPRVDVEATVEKVFKLADEWQAARDADTGVYSGTEIDFAKMSTYQPQPDWGAGWGTVHAAAWLLVHKVPRTHPHRHPPRLTPIGEVGPDKARARTRLQGVPAVEPQAQDGTHSHLHSTHTDTHTHTHTHTATEERKRKG